MIDTIQAFNEFLTKDLNTIQQEAVKHTEGSLLVVAGAGSGKTRVITARIANLILNEGVHPQSIIALTFTNKAAKEMQERIRFFLGGTTTVPFIGTFHSFCLRLLKTNSHLMQSPFMSILDADDQATMLSGIIKKHNLTKKTTAQQLAYQISHIKNHSINPENIEYNQAHNPFIKQVYMAYEQEKKASKCLDFDDLLLETLALFKKNAEFKNSFVQTIRHILVDEYQDTNVVQHELLKCMAQIHNTTKCSIDSICVVGDEDQSIYSWRGATVANIINFKKDFSSTITIKLEQNYRSVQPILDIANYVIKHNTHRNPKKLWSERIGSDRIRHIICLSDYQEGDTIANFLNIASRHQKLSTIAILYRTHFQSRVIEEGLIRQSIPYKIIGGIQFYERKEIKDLLAYLRLIINPFDRTSFFRVINVPSRSLGEKFEDLFKSRWEQEPFLTFIDIAKKLVDEGAIVGAKKSSLLSFIAIFDNTAPTDSPVSALNSIINKAQYMSYIKKSYSEEEANERIDNVKELVRAVNHFEEQNVNTVALFLDEVALLQDHKHDETKTKDPVLLMTLHAAKGLEFDTVILAGVEEGLLPSSRSLNELEKLEEERRLFYVGITRAKERLLITHCRYRHSYGQMSDQIPSRFIKEIPQQLMPTQDLARATQTQIKQFFADWLRPGESVSTTSSPVKTFGKARVTIPPTKTPKQSSPLQAGEWSKNQPVSHATFGVGIVKNIERRDAKTVIVEVQFKVGTKKIAKEFLKTV